MREKVVTMTVAGGHGDGVEGGSGEWWRRRCDGERERTVRQQGPQPSPTMAAAVANRTHGQTEEGQL